VPVYEITARISSSKYLASRIPRALALELEKPRYRRMGVRLEGDVIMKEISE